MGGVGGESHILDENIVRSWLDCYAVVTALVYHVGQFYVVDVHGIEAICVLHPVGSVRGIDCCRVVEDVVEPHVCSVHDVQGPERRVFNVDCDSNLAGGSSYGGSEDLQCSTNTSLTFQKTKGIGLPGCVFASSALYHALPFPYIPPMP